MANETHPILLEEWRPKTVADGFRITKGVTYASEDYGSEFSGNTFLTIKCFAKGGGFNPEGIKYFQGSFLPEQQLQPGELLVAKTDLTRAGDIIGSPMFLPDFGTTKKVLPSMDLCVLRPYNEKIDLRFLFYRLMLFDARRFMLAHSAGSTVLHLENSAIPRFGFYAPEPHEQGLIGIKLARLDDLIAKTEAVIAKLRQVRAGLLHDLLTRGLDQHGQLRNPIAHPEQFQGSPLGQIPRDWSSVRIAEEAEIQHGYAFDGRHFTDKPLGPRLLVPGNFHRDGGLYFTDENTKYYASGYPPDTVLSNGDMLIVMTDLSPMTLILGRTVLLNEPFPVLQNQRIGKFRLKRPEDWSPAFFVTMMNDDRLRRKVIREATGTTVRHTSPDRIRSGFALKPKPDEQTEIVARLGEMHGAIVATGHESMKLRCLKSGLMTDLLTGRVRVPVEVRAR